MKPDNREFARLILDTEHIILSAAETDGVDAAYKLLLECYEGVYDYVGIYEKKNALPVPAYNPPLFTKNFGSVIFSERLFHPYNQEKRKYTSEQLTLMQDSLLSLNEKIRLRYRENGSKDIFIWYLQKMNAWLIKIHALSLNEERCKKYDKVCF